MTDPLGHYCDLEILIYSTQKMEVSVQGTVELWSYILPIARYSHTQGGVGHLGPPEQGKRPKIYLLECM